MRARSIGDRARARLCRFRSPVVAAPFIVPSAPMGSPVTTFVTGKYGGNLLLVLALALFAAIRPLFGWFAVAVIGLGIALAIALRLWNNASPECARRGGGPAVDAACRGAVRGDLVDVRLVRAGSRRWWRDHGDRSCGAGTRVIQVSSHPARSGPTRKSISRRSRSPATSAVCSSSSARS